MKKISEKEVITKIQFENPWWSDTLSIDDYFSRMKPRAYLENFYDLISDKDVHRAVVLMGPRRVGKTVMIYHAVQRLIDRGVDPKRILYISIEAPVYIGLGLDQIVHLFKNQYRYQDLKGCYIFFDEIQYLKNWEVHLKKLVDDYRGVRFIASGSAAAALKLKSVESGAGRFTNYMLPPLTFYEYIQLLGLDGLISETRAGNIYTHSANNIKELNDESINYLNFGGYPEALFSEAIKANPHRYIRSDIIDKVLLRDLPGLYGIQDIQEMNRLFTMLAYNSGNEVSLDVLSKNSGVAKNTIKKYLEYLKAAFLITIIQRVDHSAKRFQRMNYFKIYLTNPAIRGALFGAMTADHEMIGNMVETAIVSQIVHSKHLDSFYYARWKNGEVDLVWLQEMGIAGCWEIKWSNRYYNDPKQLQSLIKFIQKNNLDIEPTVTTIDRRGPKTAEGIRMQFIEAAVYCYRIGRNITSNPEVHR